MAKVRVRRRLGVAAAAGALVASGVVLPTTVATAAPSISWGGPCEYNKDLQCGTFRVPLDYAKPTGKKITLQLERVKATGPAEEKMGTIFVNPGGPGGGGQNFSASVARRLGPEVAAKFDFVSFGPRGIGLSAPVKCFANNKAFEANWAHVQEVPLTKGQMSDAIDAGIGEAEACADGGGSIVGEMSTLNVARDLDEMRKAVGDEQLYYAGYSYGTMLGATYANVFPDRVGRLILDGPVDPDARANDRVENKRARAEGFEKALRGFLAGCAESGQEKCAFAAGDVSPAQKWAQIRTKLRQGPVQVSPSETITISTVTGTVGGAMYGRRNFIDLAVGLEDLYQTLFPPADEQRTMSKRSVAYFTGASPADPRLDQVPGATTKTGDAYDYTGTDGFFAVNCADSRGLPRSRSAYPEIASSYERTAPSFGRPEAFSESACGWWQQVQDRYAGPWDKPTNPIMVVGQTYDPATPYSMALRLTADLANAQLLSIDGFGHCSQDSVCAQKATAKYMLTGELPKPGERCGQDLGPFDKAQ